MALEKLGDGHGSKQMLIPLVVHPRTNLAVGHKFSVPLAISTTVIDSVRERLRIPRHRWVLQDEDQFVVQCNAHLVAFRLCSSAL
jgi:hypothetical protein